MTSTLHQLLSLSLLAVAPACKDSDDSRRVRELEERVSKLEAAVGISLAAPSATGSGPGGALPGLDERIARIEALERDLARTLKTVRHPLQVDKTGNEVCAQQGHTCLAVVDSAGSARYDVGGTFCGHMVADCNARVTRQKSCAPGFDFVMSPVRFYRSPGARGVCESFGTSTCEPSPASLTAICLE